MAPLDRIYAFAAAPRRLRAAAILRVGLAALTALLYLLHLHQRAFMWGVHGQTEWAFYAASVHRGPFTLYALSSSAAWAELLFWAGLATSLVYLLGVFPRLTSLLFFAFTASLYSRNPIALDGGQNLLILLALYLCFADSGAYLSLTRDTRLARACARLAAPLADALAVVHNLAMFVIAGQVCLVYYWSGFYKIGGHKWQDGTAVYYVMRTGEFAFPPFSRLVYENPAAVMLLTYSTLAFQGAFPFLMWVRRAKPFLFVAALFFHAGIALFMGLVVFSATMVVADLSIFSDSFYAGAAAFARRCARRAGWRTRLRVARSAA
jgi:hypothetical protein